MRISPLSTLALLLSLVAPACVRSSDGTIVEQIGGRLRERPFASATAYEAFLRAELAAARGNLAEADRQLGLAAFADDADPWIVSRRAHHLLAAGQTERALDVARAGTRRHPASSAIWLALAAALADGPATLAERNAALAHAVGLDPEDAEVRATAVRIASRQAATESMPAVIPSPLGVGVAVERMAAAGAWSRAAALLDASASRLPLRADDSLARAATHLCSGDVPGARLAVEALSRRRGAVDRTTLAWLWWRVGERSLAAEESALAMSEGVVGAAAVRALTLAAGDQTTRALRVAALVATADRVPGVASPALAPWAGRCARAGAVGRAEASPPGSALVLVTATLAAALDRAGHSAIGDLAIVRAAQRLRSLAVAGAAARDALRVASATRQERLGRPSDAAWEGLETPDGQLAAAAARAWPTPLLRIDEALTVRAPDSEATEWSAAWRVLLCARSPAGCAEVGRAADEAAVLTAVDEAPVVLRAQALLRRDSSALDRAAEADPRSPWDAWIRARLAAPADPGAP